MGSIFPFPGLAKAWLKCQIVFFLQIVTEFGRSLMLKAGKTLTRIETIKKWLPEVQPIILTHVGSNQVSILVHFKRGEICFKWNQLWDES